MTFCNSDAYTKFTTWSHEACDATFTAFIHFGEKIPMILPSNFQAVFHHPYSINTVILLLRLFKASLKVLVLISLTGIKDADIWKCLHSWICHCIFFKFTDINNDHMFILLNSGGQCKAAISITGDLHCWFWKGVIWLKYSYLCWWPFWFRESHSHSSFVWKPDTKLALSIFKWSQTSVNSHPLIV